MPGGDRELPRVAVIADVHGNAPALAAVLDQIADASIDVIVSCGDLTWVRSHRRRSR